MFRENHLLAYCKKHNHGGEGIIKHQTLFVTMHGLWSQIQGLTQVNTKRLATFYVTMAQILYSSLQLTGTCLLATVLPYCIILL